MPEMEHVLLISLFFLSCTTFFTNYYIYNKNIALCLFSGRTFLKTH